GFNGPLLVVAKLPHPSPGVTAPTKSGEARQRTAPRPGGTGTSAAALERLHAWLAASPGVASVGPVRINPARNVAAISLFPLAPPRLVQRLRAGVAGQLPADAGATVCVGGVTAGGVDFATTLGHKLPLFIGVVVLLSALLLMVVFRSLVIPIQAAVMNLLSIGA